MINDDTLNFSFSGLKTAVLREWKKHSNNLSFDSVYGERSRTTQDKQLTTAFAYEIQEAITDVLVDKTIKAAKIHNVKSIVVSGGVAANLRLREKFKSKFKILNSKFSLHIPDPKLCVDSASFIAAYAYYHNHPLPWQHIQALPDLSVEI